MTSVNTGKYQPDKPEGNDENEIGYWQSRENDKIDSKYGFDRVKDTQERTGYLVNMHTTEILDDDRRLVAALDLFFIQMDGSRYKTSIVFQPYFLILARAGRSLEVARFLKKKFSGRLANLEHIQKEDLDLANHLSGLRQEYLKLSFTNNNNLKKVRRELLAAVNRNKDRERQNTDYMQMLSNSLHQADAGTSTNHRQQFDYMDFIMDIREHDVLYHVRVSIDLKINCGLWYNVRCKGGGIEAPVITPRPDILERPEPVILAFDIETTKLPLKFPDAQTDQIIMISYMIDGQGYLITNREIISMDVADFEYTPTPEYEGNFIIFNESNEVGLLQKFFDHIMEVRPHVIVTYNGDFFDWPFVETRAAVYDIHMNQEIGFSKSRDGTYLCRPTMHMDCLCWVKRDSYLPVGSQGLKAVAKAKLRYDPVELDPEEMCKMAVEQPQVLSNYSVSDAVATYYLYMKYVNPFIFALATIIPMEPDEVLRKGSGTLCEALLMVQAFHANIVFPNKEQSELNKLSDDGHVLDAETYVGGHVEALESGVFRADIPCRFRVDRDMIARLQNNVDQVLAHAIETEEGIPLSEVLNLTTVTTNIQQALQRLHDQPVRLEPPIIFHLDVGAMYPNIILTNRLQPSAVVNEADCAKCDFNRPDAVCKRDMEWLWRGEMLPASKNEFQRIQQQLEMEKFPPLFPNGPTRAFHELSKEDRAGYEKKRLADYCRKAYKKTKITRLETRTSTICQKENSFYVDTVRAFRDRRYDYKGLTKVAKAAVATALASNDAVEIKAAKSREVLYDSLQLAHKCILNSFYGYVMRRGARWHSMPMAGIVCLTGSNIIRKAREIIERVGRPLELDTDGIWCILPETFPQELTIETSGKRKKLTISYPNAVLNCMVKDHFTNEQYHELIASDVGGPPKYKLRSENSIFFEVDGPYLAMVLPAAKEEGKRLKKRYAVFNFDGSLAELKGFEVKRRGELQLIKIFQSSVFDAFLHGNTIEECYASVAKVADYWLDVLYSKGNNMPDSELFGLISENRSMSKKLEDYGAQKSTSISTAKRLAEFLGDQMVKDAGLACKYVISRKPEGAPVSERAIPLAIFQSEQSVRRHFLRRWLKDNTMGDADIRDVLDWGYYIERLGGTIQKIITIPAALQGLANPVPRVQHPDWLHKRMLEKTDVLKQRRINEIFQVTPKEKSTNGETTDIEDVCQRKESTSGNSNPIPIVHKRKRTTSNRDEEIDEGAASAKSWREALGAPPPIGENRTEIQAWLVWQKKKWRWQIKNCLNKRKSVHPNNKRFCQTESIIHPPDRHASAQPVTIGGFLRRNQRSIIEQPWQIIQIQPIDSIGHYNLWAMIGEELHKIKLVIPRIFYVNQRSPAPQNDGDTMWKKVFRILPRARPVYYLYQYSIPEQVFQDNRLGMLADLATPDIEGIYETQMSLDFRAVIDLGCVCSVQRSEMRRMLAQSNMDFETFQLQQLEFRTVTHQPYLQSMPMKKLLLYQHGSLTGKREIWSIILPPIKRGLVIVLDTVRANQMPSMKNLYTTERAALVTAGTTSADHLPPEDMSFDVFFEIDIKQVYRHIQRMLTGYKNEKKGPTLLCVQSSVPLNKLNISMSILSDFPQSQIHIADDASLLSGLEWQRSGARSLIRHFLNLNTVVNLMLEQCRYFHLPIGNMPADTVLFGADLFYARLLQRHNFVLWTSPSGRPDLGGREADDSRLLAEFEDNITIVQNRTGFYGNVCVELAVNSLAVSALLQANKVQELEGTSSAITFDTIPQASLDDMMANKNASQLPIYDDTALCSSAFRVMRTMISGWLREVSLNRNAFSDFQIIHFYRWIRSSTALLYDPALRRALNNLMRKLFLQIMAEFQRLGAQIIYGDFNRIILNTNKTSVIDALSYVEYIVQSIRNKEIFHSVDLSYQQCWEFLLWMDPANFSGVRGKLPADLLVGDSIIEQNLTGDRTGEMDNGEDERKTLDMNWNIGEQLKLIIDSGQDDLDQCLTAYMESIIEHGNTDAAISSITHLAFEIVQKLQKSVGRDKNSNPALAFVNALNKILSINVDRSEKVLGLRRNMLRLINIGEFSDLAIWQEPNTSYVLSEVICKACNHCRDVDLCKDKDKALKNGIPVWLCSNCYVYYDNDEIELKILDVVQRKLMTYTIQDLRCVRCKEIKRENLSELCSCAGQFETLYDPIEMRKLFSTFLQLAKDHEMSLLQEQMEWILKLN